MGRELRSKFHFYPCAKRTAMSSFERWAICRQLMSAADQTLFSTFIQCRFVVTSGSFSPHNLYKATRHTQTQCWLTNQFAVKLSVQKIMAKCSGNELGRYILIVSMPGVNKSNSFAALRPVHTGNFCCDFSGDFCCDFKRDFAACKLLAIQIAAESPVVYAKSPLKSPA